jgi:epoxyqueuosine reductase QueG
MNNELTKELLDRGMNSVHFVDISALPKEATLGFDKAIIFLIALTKEYVLDLLNGAQVDEQDDEFLLKEQQIEETADWLAEYLKQKGYNAHSQSEKNNFACGYIETGFIDPDHQEGVCVLPQKAIARLAGLGFIGKNDLLVTEEYGCAVCICSVLTDAPVQAENRPIMSSKCGTCVECVKNCPANALTGNEWTESGDRASLVDVTKCYCMMKCVLACPWTLRYAG